MSLQASALMISAATARKTYGPTDLTNARTRGYLVASSIEPRPSGLESDAQSTRLLTYLSTCFNTLRPNTLQRTSPTDFQIHWDSTYSDLSRFPPTSIPMSS
ncbi:hypothetical protein TNCV_1389681 [Trichonephila clavipes]|nr:hypothetical protein TNCV_1389681 [Trichonephila clavipes]